MSGGREEALHLLQRWNAPTRTKRVRHEKKTGGTFAGGGSTLSERHTRKEKEMNPHSGKDAAHCPIQKGKRQKKGRGIAVPGREEKSSDLVDRPKGLRGTRKKEGKEKRDALISSPS